MLVSPGPRIADTSPRSSRPQASAPPTVGASIFVDSFESSESHGHYVEGAAASLGPTGPTVRQNQRQMIDGQVTMPHARATTRLQLALSAQPLSPDQAAETLQQFVRDSAAGNLDLASNLLGQIEATGYRNSVVNLSQGIDALVLLQLSKAALGPKSRLSSEAQQTYRTNLGAALNLAPGSDEKSTDQATLELIKGTLKGDPEVQKSVEGWRDSVRSFESGHNSVVVAAGNSGTAIKGLARAGFSVDGSEDLNLLAVPEVTTVGATAVDNQGRLVFSGSSSFGPEVDVLANGDHQGRFGTSYAAPKVANALRAVHLANPDFSSDEAERYLSSRLSDPATIAGQPVAILDDRKATILLAQ